MREAPTETLDDYLADRSTQVEAALDAVLPPRGAFPSVVHDAMRHSVFAGGKRLRPLLVIAAAEATGGAAGTVLPAACAVELIHTYSLIHDDLPSMDDSATRRGRPTCHVVFGEAVAVLAGDALHALAFDLLARTPPPAPAAAVVRLVGEVAASIGTEGMVGGQVLDLLGERRPHLPAIATWPGVPKEAVTDIHVRKTGALIRVSVRAGALLSGAPASALEALSEYGARLGLAFQIVDDVLDEVGEAARMGKGVQQDAQRAKLTFPAVWGVQRSREMAEALTGEAVAALAPLGSEGGRLAEMARWLLGRDA
ncbi:MAG: polyprenyl synthetase family protein [bacterium]